MNKKIERLTNETDTSYKLRVNFIKLNNPKTKSEMNMCIMFSKIFVNVVLLECRYSTDIEKKLNKNSNKIKKILKNIKY